MDNADTARLCNMASNPRIELGFLKCRLYALADEQADVIATYFDGDMELVADNEVGAFHA